MGHIPDIPPVDQWTGEQRSKLEAVATAHYADELAAILADLIESANDTDDVAALRHCIAVLASGIPEIVNGADGTPVAVTALAALDGRWP